MKFKTKVAYSAVLATLGLAAGSAQAAYLSEDGTGQVLLYPYYTVQNGFDTYMSVVNTTASPKAVKVRFIEGKASQEVLDFNLYMSAYDVWTAAVTSALSGGGARVVTKDTSCTAPMLNGSVDFRNIAYTGTGDDPYEDELSRTREGYVEIIEMGPIAGDTVDTTNKPFAWRITHAATTTGWKPNDCNWVSDQFANATDATTLTPFVTPPTGGLVGSATLINVAQGVDYSYDPVVIGSFMALANHTSPGSLLPSLNSAAPTSTVIRSSGSVQQAVTTNWTTGRQAVSAILAHTAIINEYTVEAALSAGTDWIVTFPTKRMHLTAGGTLGWGYSVSNNPGYEAPFTKAPRDSVLDYPTWLKWRACEPIAIKRWDREELTSGSIDFSPTPPGGNTLCYEANVITFKNTNVLSSSNVLNLSSVYENGWARISFATQSLVSAVGATTVNGVGPFTGTYGGLPAVGFAVQKYVNGNVGGVLSNYGGAFIHKYNRSIVTN